MRRTSARHLLGKHADVALPFLALAITKAHSLAPSKWGVTRHGEWLRFNFASTEAMTISASECRVLIIGDPGPTAVRGLSLEPSPYRSAPKAQIARFTFQTKARTEKSLEQLAPFHLAFLAQQSIRPINPGSRRGHRDESIDAIVDATGSPLPYPTHRITAVSSKLPQEELSANEGRRLRITINAYERDERLRRACLRRFGFACSVCGILLSDVYGHEATGIIHIHHLEPLATRKGRGTPTSAADLRPVCPNCHSVIHARSPAFSIDEVKQMLRKRSRQRR